MALLYGAVELDDSEAIVALLEGREVEAIACHEFFLADGGGGVLGAVLTTVSGEDGGGLGRDMALLHVRGRRRVVVRHGVEAQWGSTDLWLWELRVFSEKGISSLLRRIVKDSQLACEQQGKGDAM